MVTETRNQNQMESNDTRALLWTLLALVIVAVLSYAVYAAYYGPAYNRTAVTGTSTNTEIPATTTTNQ